MERIEGYICLPVPLTGRFYVSVALIDASLADSAAQPVCSCESEIHVVASIRVPFSLAPPDRPLVPGTRWLFDATVTRLPDKLLPGDFVLARSIEFPVALKDDPLLLPLERIT